MLIRKIFTAAWLVVILTVIVGLFWNAELVYNLPTPVPENYKTISIGEVIDLDLASTPFDTRPLFFHFFNPDCPCSRFNIPHFKSLVKLYGNKVNFIIVLVGKRAVTEKEINDKFDLEIPILADNTLALKCGVYSTPQAAILDFHHQLYYRGNYNRSRYCSDTKTEYARIALEALLRSNTTVVFDQFALKAYGCQLPLCTSK